MIADPEIKSGFWKFSLVSKGRGTVQSIVPILFLSLLLSQCATLSHKSDSFYYSKNFQCWNSTGWKDKKRYQSYLEFHQGMVEKYENLNREKKQANIVLVGDSLTHFFPSDLIDDQFRGLDVVNRGIGGDMSDLLLERLDRTVLALEPRIVVLEIGGNDLLQGKCLSYVESNIDRIVDGILSTKSVKRLILLGIPPLKSRQINSITPVLNLHYYDLSLTRKKVIFLDSWKYMRQSDIPAIRKEFEKESDEIHFNRKGYEVWVKMLKPYLKI